jgi:YVTN family beta-propeller protein
VRLCPPCELELGQCVTADLVWDRRFCCNCLDCEWFANIIRQLYNGNSYMPRPRFLSLIYLVLALVCASCGGGGSSNTPPPPPSGDFQLSFAADPLVLQQGSANGEQINLTALDGFTGNVTLSFSALPAGITVSPTFPTTISYTEGLGVSFAASSSAAIGSSTITLTGTSGSITHSITLTVQIDAPPSFQLSLNPSSVTLTPNSSASVQVTLSGTIPAGSNVAVEVPFNTATLPGVTSSGPVYVSTAQPTATFQVIAALDAAAASSVPVEITGTSGSTVVNVNLFVSVNNTFPSSGPPSRSTFRRTDMDPTSAVYDSTRKQVFVAVPQLNEVLVYSSVDAHKIATIPVPAPNGLDMSADGTKLIVASRTEAFCLIDPAGLQLESCNPVITSSFAVPETLNALTLANGNILFVVGDAEGSGGTGLVGSGSGLLEWNATTGAFSAITPASIAPVVAFARSADHSTVAVAGQSEIGLFSSASDSFVSMTSFPFGYGSLAVNPNGSNIAVLSNGRVQLFDNHFTLLATYSLSSTFFPTGLLFSYDGSEIYVLSDSDFIVCLNSGTLAPIGLVSAQGYLGFGGDTDETGMIFAPEAGMRGIGFFDASAPRAVGTDAPGNFSVSPRQGSPTDPGTATISAVGGLTSGSLFYFDGTPASSTPAQILSLSPPTTAQVAPPPDSAGAVNVTITNPDGQVSIAPDGFSYGPTVVAMTPNGAPPSGQTSVTLMGYGLDFPQDEIQVAVGGQPATVTGVFAGVQFSPFPFPMDTIKFTVPAGTPGLADVTVTTPDGSVTATKAFQYLNSVQSFPIAGALGQLIYDKPRQRLYTTNYATNQVDVFDLQSQSYIAAINVGQSPAGLSLTPDGTRLVVANNGASTVTVIDPSTLAVTATIPLPVPPSISQCGSVQPLWAATTSSNLAIISVACSNVIAGNFEILNLNTQTFGCGSSSGCSQFVSLFGSAALNVSADAGGTEIFASENDVSGAVPIAVWDVTNDSVAVQSGFGPTGNVAADADGTLFAADNAVFTPDSLFRYLLQDVDYLQAGADSITSVPGEKLHDSGSLAYDPQTNAIEIFDVHHGRLVWQVGLPFQMQSVLDEMALDETGSRIFCIATNGISILQLSSVPVSIGTVTPSTASGEGGTPVVVRGSGFQSGLTLQVGTQSVAATVVDSSTIDFNLPPLPTGSVRLTITNPDGSTYSLDGAVLIQ